MKIFKKIVRRKFFLQKSRIYFLAIWLPIFRRLFIKFCDVLLLYLIQFHFFSLIIPQRHLLAAKALSEKAHVSFSFMRKMSDFLKTTYTTLLLTGRFRSRSFWERPMSKLRMWWWRFVPCESDRNVWLCCGKCENNWDNRHHLKHL